MKKTRSERAAVVLATWFGCGYWPFGPGTAGSLAALLIGIVVERTWAVPAWSFAVFAAAAAGPAIWSAGVAARAAESKDPGLVVIDEVVGQWMTLAGATVFNWKSYASAFVLFRLFDIWKPWPVGRLEALPSGTGIVADDLMAGVYGALVLYVAGCFNFYS